ncbi:MAG TPA: ABC transporter ATP-binding protein [Balneolales bacterium]|nr:ABC transporter ATP-binding protein [Balneolales bacterium]
MQGSQVLIKLEDISKSFNDTEVLNDISLSLNGGTCFGLVGNNGVGKSTLINILIDLIKPDKGNVEVAGKSYFEDGISIKQLLGILPEESPVNLELTAYEQLWLTGLMYHIPKNELSDRIDSLYSFFFDDMDSLKKECSSFSTGMTQKLKLVAALMHKPKILILDEPFAGLDPSSSHQLIDFLSSYLNDDRLILLSSHNLSYVEKIANRVGILNDHHFVYDGSMEELTEKGTKIIENSLFELIKPQRKDEGGIQWLMD